MKKTNGAKAGSKSKQSNKGQTATAQNENPVQCWTVGLGCEARDFPISIHSHTKQKYFNSWALHLGWAVRLPVYAPILSLF